MRPSQDRPSKDQEPWRGPDRRYRRASGIVALVLTGLAPAKAGAQQPATAAPIVLDRVTVVDVERGN